jgi:lipid-binding SYLF domain-containing protein
VKLALVLLLGLACSCRSIPGDTVEEKRAYIDAWEQETLEMLYEEQPQARESIEEAPGYLAVGQRIVKIPFVGWGGGYGVLVDRVRDKRLYVKLNRMDVGGGLGARNLRVVLVIHDPKLLKKAGKATWSFGGGAEASAKAGESGAAGGMGTGQGDAEYTVYELTDEGVSVTWTLHAIRLSEHSALN